MSYNIRKNIYKTVVFVLLAVFCNAYAQAQGPNDPGGPGGEECPPDSSDPDCDPDANVPIDGGASVLIAAGVAYGLKKVHDKRKQSKEEDNA